MTKYFVLSLLAVLTASISAQAASTLSYSIAGDEAIEIFESLIPSSGAYEVAPGVRENVIMNYENFGLTRVRIRTVLNCVKAQAICTISTETLVFVTNQQD